MALSGKLLAMRGMIYPPLFVLAVSAIAGTATYKLDFGTATSPVAEGFQAGVLATFTASTKGWQNLATQVSLPPENPPSDFRSNSAARLNWIEFSGK